ncbi:unnamed protein product [Dovyalis caffra]|uniref:VIN3-like C-terminal domain-containing protein n=1 Tax=Dovyalis caffra TaxID=77055 RepID=A0AAV1S8M9_9ROSI|nr:unnamed protein product [Dovyalis caffra]
MHPARGHPSYKKGQRGEKRNRKTSEGEATGHDGIRRLGSPFVLFAFVLPLLSFVKGQNTSFVLDPSKCSQLSLEERRELVREIAQWSKDAPEVLNSFTRRELLEIICAEMGKQRKYSGYTKFQMIKHLLKLVSKTSKRSNIDNIMAFSPPNPQAGFKRQRKKESQLHLSIDLNLASVKNNSEEHNELHLKVVRHPMRVAHAKKVMLVDLLIIPGCMFGVYRNWRKQLLVAKEARRVDVLCQRVLLGYRMLTGTEKYKELQKSMETALRLLKNELGPLDLVCSKMARGIANRLSCGAEVQKLCASTVEAFDSMFADNYHAYLEQNELICKFLLIVSSFDQSNEHMYGDYAVIQFEESSPRLQAGKDIDKNKNEGISSGSLSPSTPCKSNGMQEVLSSDCKKRIDESAYEYSVRVVKWLEFRGHIDEDFRVKFLTWFSLKATMQDRRVVNVFVDALIDDPRSLAEQLIDTFMDKICYDQKLVPRHGPKHSRHQVLCNTNAPPPRLNTKRNDHNNNNQRCSKTATVADQASMNGRIFWFSQDRLLMLCTGTEVPQAVILILEEQIQAIYNIFWVIDGGR